jgi:cobaltochelatase CobS
MTATINNWKSYRVGSIVKVGDVDWTIVDIEKRATDGGYTSRLFHLRGPNGENVVKTSRGLTLWQQSGDSSSVESSTVADVEKEVAAEAADANVVLARAIAAAVQPYIEAVEAATGVNRDEVNAIVDERVKAVVPQRVEVIHVDGTVVDVGVQHVQFGALLRIVSQRLNTWLVGPAGSGKTSAAHAVATSLGLPFFAKSVGPQTSESSLLGYYDANGRYVRTQLRDAFENGGVFLLDEVDAGNPAVLVVINALLANGHCSFPDAVVAKHPDFVLVAGANTIGQGADRQYVGRQQIDAATLDRFVLLPWDYDARIEAAACGVPVEFFSEAAVPSALDFVAIDDETVVGRRVETYVKKVVAIRNAIAGFGTAVRVIVSPRASIHGVRLIRAGFRVEDVLDLCVWKGCDRDTRKKIEANC